MKTQKYKNKIAQKHENKSSSYRCGFTLIEIIIALAASSVVMTVAALLIQSGYRSWNASYKSANGELREGSIEAMTSLGSIGRKSNRMNYNVYTSNGSTFTRAVPVSDPEEIVTGDAVELRYWKNALQTGYMDPALTATAYALYYVDSNQLKVDIYVPPSSTPSQAPPAVNAAGHRNTSNITTTVLAKNVIYLKFSHTTKTLAGDGNGCIRMKMITRDPAGTETKTTMVASMMRNIWPQ
jgi:prepilin-type N-terminal cleavage/methylation domain-containing protein